MASTSGRAACSRAVPSLGDFATEGCIAAAVEAEARAAAEAAAATNAAREQLAEAEALVRVKKAELKEAESREQATAQALALSKRAARVKFMARPTPEQAAKLNAFAEALLAMGCAELCDSGRPEGLQLDRHSSRPCQLSAARPLRPFACPLCAEALAAGFETGKDQEGLAQPGRAAEPGSPFALPHFSERLGLVCTNGNCVGRSVVFYLGDGLRLKLCSADQCFYQHPGVGGSIWATPAAFDWVRHRVPAIKLGVAAEDFDFNAPERSKMKKIELCPTIFVTEKPLGGRGCTTDALLQEWRESMYFCDECIHLLCRHGGVMKSVHACHSCVHVFDLHPEFYKAAYTADRGSFRECRQCRKPFCRACGRPEPEEVADEGSDDDACWECEEELDYSHLPFHALCYCTDCYVDVRCSMRVVRNYVGYGRMW